MLIALAGLGLFAVLVVPFIFATGHRARRRPLITSRALDARPGFANSRKLIKTSLVGERQRWLAIGDGGAILCGGDGLPETSFAPGRLSQAEVIAGHATVARASRAPEADRAEDPTPAWKEISEVTLRLKGQAGESFAIGFKTFEHGAPSLPEFMLQEAVEWLQSVAAAQGLSR